MMRKEDYVVLATFRTALRRFLRFVETGARDAGVTPQQHQVLLAIRGQREREWATIGEVAEALQMKHHAAVGLVDRCQAAGLLQRSHDLEDRRVVRVSLTSKGEDILTTLTQRNLVQLRSLGKLASELQTLAGSAEHPES